MINGAKTGVVFLEVNVDKNKVTVQSFMDQYKLNMPVLLDAKEVVRKSVWRHGLSDNLFYWSRWQNSCEKNRPDEESFIDEYDR